jgi:hypothetical protein
LCIEKARGKTVSISFYTIAVLAASPMLAIHRALLQAEDIVSLRRARQPSIMR